MYKSFWHTRLQCQSYQRSTEGIVWCSWLAEAHNAQRNEHNARVCPPAAALVTCNDRDEIAEAIQHRQGSQQPKIRHNGVGSVVIEEEVIEDAGAPEPAPCKDSVAASEQHSIGEVCQGDRRRRTQHRELHYEHVAVVQHQ